MNIVGKFLRAERAGGEQGYLKSGLGELRGGRRGNYRVENYGILNQFGIKKAHKVFTGSITVLDRIYSTALIQPLVANQLIRSFNLQKYPFKHTVSGQLANGQPSTKDYLQEVLFAAIIQQLKDIIPSPPIQ